MRRRWLLVPAALMTGTLTMSGMTTALAVSSGSYSPAKQGCSVTADSNSAGNAQPGCHNAQLMVGNGAGDTVLEAGTYQTAPGQNPHAGSIVVAPNGTATPSGSYSGTGAGVTTDTNYQPIPPDQCDLEDIALYPVTAALYVAGQGPAPCTLNPAAWSPPSQAPSLTPSVAPGPLRPATLLWLRHGEVYFGADDNLDSGEHDGVNGQYGSAGAANGPSDGGSLVVRWNPGNATSWTQRLAQVLHGGPPAPVLEHPLPVAAAGGGACADGICANADTQRTTLYQGGAPGSRDVYDYSGTGWPPYDCNSGSPANEKACITQGGTTMTQYRQAQPTVVAEPGVQVFEDPDPQGSPALPPAAYPLPAAYVGTCGVTAGGGAIGLPASPVTNSAGQASASTGC